MIALSTRGTMTGLPFLVTGIRHSLRSQLISSQRIIKVLVLLTPVRREVAKWESALQELVDKELLIARGYKNQIFDITNLGYQIADMISI